MFRFLRRASIVLSIAMMVSCASVPQESVSLSETVGSDLEALNTSYRKLISAYFDLLRNEVNSAIDSVYVPAYIKSFTKSGRLVENAQAENDAYVLNWVNIAVETIEMERAKRLQPIKDAENALRDSVDAAFAQAVRANEAVTAHLSSIRKVEEFQKEVLSKVKLNDVHERIQDALIKASNQAREITNQINAKSEEN